MRHPARPRRLFSDFRDLKKVWPYLRVNKKLLFVSCTLVPLISLLQMGVPFILKRTIDQGVLKGDFQVMLWGAIAYFLVVVIEYGVRATQSILTSKAVFQMIRSMRLALIDHIMRLAATYHDRNLSGALVTRATSDFDNLSESLNQGVLSSIVDLAVLCGALVGLFLLDWRLALITLMVLPVVIVIIVFFSRVLKKSMLLARVKIAALNAYTQECLYGSSTIKVLGAHRDTQVHFDKLAIEYRDAQMKSVVADAVLFSLLDGVSSVTMGLVLWFTVKPSSGPELLSAGILIAFVQYVQNLFDPLKQLANKIAMLQGAFTAMERIFGIFDTQDFIAGDRLPPALSGEVAFDQVSFAYRGRSETPVLSQLSFQVPQGRSLALVGATGSGKSTVVKLLTKMYDGYTGEIRIDGLPISDLSGAWLRRNIAIVPQDIVIFHGSIAFNIGLGDPDISQSDIESAARYVGAERFIQKLPEAYDFELREGGDNISLGQRQLLAFARAIVRNPRIIILDEATSNIDPASDAAVQSAIDKLFSGRTLIVIAHRLSTIQRCDQILVLDRGQKMEVGTHHELLNKKAYYFALHEKLLQAEVKEKEEPALI